MRKFLLIPVIIVLLLSISPAAVKETSHLTKKDLKEDITILKRILKRKPNDTVSLKRLLKIYFTLEDFQMALETASRYLALEKDKEAAYIKIISYGNQGEYKKALKEINLFLKTYAVTDDEKKLFENKRKVYKGYQTKASPGETKRIAPGNEKIFLGLIERKKAILGYDRKKENLFYYFHNNGSFKSLKNIPVFLEDIDIKNILFISMSPGGRELLATVRKGVEKANILYRKKAHKEEEWSSWKTIGNMNPGAWNGFGNFTSDTKGVIFSSDMDDAGGLDIYITMKNYRGNWSSPEKLKTINTPLDEYSLFLHPDGETLFFTTNGRKGMGGFDIFGSKLSHKDDTYTVSKIKNIKELNTFRNESFPLMVNKRGDAGFFNFSAGDNFSLYSTDTLLNSPRPVSFFDCTVYDKKTREPVSEGDVKIMKVGKRERRGVLMKFIFSDGFFGVPLQDGSQYLVSISAKGYLYYRKKVTIKKTGESEKRKLTFYIKRGAIKKGFSFEAKDIHFDTGSAKFKMESEAELHNVYNFLALNPDVTIEIAGFTDSVGNYKKNMELSQMRANAIADYLVKKGIIRKRLISRGFGESGSKASNKTEKDRRKNRRVEITVLKID
ncbi:MAG: OmpA family protein [bacterium]|nr:OmpA family protein [bacterium]